jgi:hypothetical protein
MGLGKKEGLGPELGRYIYLYYYNRVYLTKVSLVTTHGLGFRKEGIGPELGAFAEPAPTVVPCSKPVVAGYSFVFNNQLGRFIFKK